MLRKSIAGLSAVALAVVMAGLVPIAATATQYSPPEEECLLDPGQEEEGYWEPHDAVIVHHDAVTHEETVVDEPAVWANWAPNDTKGPQDYTPIWPDDDRGTWIVHDQLPPGHEGPDGVYQQGAGNSPWFYRSAEVSHTETVVDEEAWDETVEEAWDEWVVTQEYIAPTYGPCPPEEDDTDYVTVAWRMDGWAGPSTAVWGDGQEYVTHQGTDEADLGVLDDDLAAIGWGCYQIDVYYDDATTDSLIAGGELFGPNDPEEHLAWDAFDYPNNPWKFLQVGEGCDPPEDEPNLVVPSILEIVNPCGVDNDGFVLPEDTDLIDYWEENGSIIAALKNVGDDAWDVAQGSGWVFDDDNTIRFTFLPAGESGSPFTDEPCEPVCEVQDVAIWHTWTGGPIEEGVTPSADDPAWNANSGDPQSANHLFENHEAGVPYFVSHGGSGNGDWFLWTLEDCPPDPVLETPTIEWTYVNSCEDLNGEGNLDVTGATLESFTWNGEPWAGSVDDFHPGTHTDPLNGHFVLTFVADDGYSFGEGNGTFVIDIEYKDSDDCVKPVAVQFSAEPTPATCAADGTLDTAVFPIVGEFYTLTVDRPYDGPGVYTITATAHEGFVFEGEGDPTVRTLDVTVDAQLVGPDCRAIEEATLTATLVPMCIQNVPFVDWTATLTDPDNQSENHDTVTFTFLNTKDLTGDWSTGGLPLADMGSGTYSGSGTFLWPFAAYTGTLPGAIVGTEWPGFELVGEVWEGPDLANGGWTLGGVNVRADVNPSFMLPNPVMYPDQVFPCAPPVVEVNEELDAPPADPVEAEAQYAG